MNEQQANPAFRSAWRKNWLHSIAELANLELQRATWLDPENDNPHWSYGEFMCCYFDDLALTEGYEFAEKRGLVTSKEAEVVWRMHLALDAYQEPGKDVFDYEGILADPAWMRVVNTVQAAQTELAAILTDPGEIRVLFQDPLSADR